MLDLTRVPHKVRLAMQQELTDFVNELPESVYHLGRDDARLVVDRMLAAARVEASRAENEAQFFDRR